MSYVGGKSKNSEFIITILNDPKYNDMDYLEPFMGYAHILRRIKNKSSYTASDNNENLVNLMEYVQKSSSYPDITKDEYQVLKKNNDSCKIRRAFAAFCYSYNGKEFGGFTEFSKEQKNGIIRNYPAERKRYYNTLFNNDTFKQTNILLCDYDHHNVKNTLIYCDPPYQKTTGYNNSGIFNSDIFWDTMRKWSVNNTVYISEYNAPDDFICIAEHTKFSSLSGSGASSLRLEKLFKWRDSEK